MEERKGPPVIIATDLHLEEDSADLVLGTVLPGVLQTASQLGDPEVTLLGDLVSGRYRTPSRLVVGLYDIVRAAAKSGIQWRVLPGNHDMFDINGRSILEVLSEIPNVVVFREPRWDRHGLWVPYQPATEAFMKALTRVPPRIPPPRRLWMHQGVMGAFMNSQARDTAGIPLEAFQTWERVFSGHYHLHHTVGNVTYIGSPWQVSASEANQKKGFCQWDGKQLWFHEREWGPRHVKLDLSAPLDLGALKPTDVVSAVVPAHMDLAQLGKQLAAAGIKNHTLTPEVVYSEARLDVGAGADLGAFAKAYVDKLAPATLSKERLMSMFGEVAS